MPRRDHFEQICKKGVLWQVPQPATMRPVGLTRLLQQTPISAVDQFMLASLDRPARSQVQMAATVL